MSSKHMLDLAARCNIEAERYTRRNILRSELMYGRGFQSPGGLRLVEAFCARLHLHPGMRALEIGSGLGGSAFYLAEHRGLHVLGLDVSSAMIEISRERLEQAGLANVTFVLGDIRHTELQAASFDLVWTRDCVLYIAEKAVVWRQVLRCLKPGAELFVTDFARGEGPLSPEFQLHIDACGFHLQTLDDYAHSLAAAGLTVVAGEDITTDFVTEMERERAQLAERRDALLRELDPEDYDHLIERWDQKIAFCRAGELKWGLFIARKP